MPPKRKEIIQLIQQTIEQQMPTLDLSKCNLGELIDDVCRMVWLTELNLSHCHLVDLPDEIGELINLTRLDLSENQLAELPESISHLTSLQHLHLTRAGYNFKLSPSLEKWAGDIPELIWENKPQPVPAIADQVFLGVDHPNLLLGWISNALKLYGDAFNMEERGFGGTGKREEADRVIGQIFMEAREMKEIFPEFYDDFKEHRFYWSNRDSEKTIDGNPFRLPTTEDDRERLKFSDLSNDLPPLRLIDEVSQGERKFFVINTGTSQKSEVFSSEYGATTVSNQPTAADDRYFADCGVTLFQAGGARFYVLAEIDGLDGRQTHWYGSDDGGIVWQKQADLTNEWLAKNCGGWRKLSFLCLKRS